jgi:hypothetical protein
MKAKAVSNTGALTGAVDENGVLIPLSNFDIERLTRDEVLDFQERRRQQIADAETQRREDDDFARYRERFGAAGGDVSDARASWLAGRKAAVADAAASAEREALEDARRHVRQTL